MPLGGRHEAENPLEGDRVEELRRMWGNIRSFDPSCRIVRHCFIRKVAKLRTPLHSAVRRSNAARGKEKS
jgi:hypothetical protein